MAQWLAKASGSDRGFAKYCGGMVAVDGHAMKGLLSLGSETTADDGKSFVQAVSVACRQRFETDLGLAVGPLPASNDAQAGAAGEAGRVYFALASAAGVETFRISSGIHPDIVLDDCAKHAMNFVRLALLKDAIEGQPRN